MLFGDSGCHKHNLNNRHYSTCTVEKSECRNQISVINDQNKTLKKWPLMLISQVWKDSLPTFLNMWQGLCSVYNGLSHYLVKKWLQ